MLYFLTYISITSLNWLCIKWLTFENPKMEKVNRWWGVKVLNWKKPGETSLQNEDLTKYSSWTLPLLPEFLWSPKEKILILFHLGRGSCLVILTGRKGKLLRTESNGTLLSSALETMHRDCTVHQAAQILPLQTVPSSPAAKKVRKIHDFKTCQSPHGKFWRRQ